MNYSEGLMANTTIQLSQQATQALAKLKTHPRETYEDVVWRLVEGVPAGDDEGAFTPQFRAGIARGLADVRSGRVVAAADVYKKLRLK